MTSKLQQLSDQTKQRKAAILRPELRAPYGPEFPPVYDQTVLDALRHTCFDDGALNAKMVAREIGKAESTAYDKLRGDVEITLAEFCRIVRLSVAHGATELIDLMLPDGTAIFTIQDCDASLEAEVTDLIHDTGETIENLRNGKLRNAERASQRVANDAGRIQTTVRKARR